MILDFILFSQLLQLIIMLNKKILVMRYHIILHFQCLFLVTYNRKQLDTTMGANCKTIADD